MDSARRILIVDDYTQLVGFLEEKLTAEGYSVTTCSSGKESLEVISTGFIGVILLDVRLPDISGLDLLDQINKISPDLPVIIITAHATVDMAVQATRRGGFDFIAKGSDLLKRLSVSVKNAFERLAMIQRLKSLEDRVGREMTFDKFLTVSPRMQEILKTLQSVVNSPVSVLIEGESGTGKELIARAIRANSKRKDGPFMAVNCAGIPENLLESEMFGYEKGAFTGATNRRAGKFEAANDGTLFLDEVGELPMSLQAKLLRVLQDRSFQRVGGTQSVEVNVRIISATNRDLMEEVKAGRFREDLFYRLSVFPVRLLPLRQRPEDIPMLAENFLKHYSKEEDKEFKGFTKVALSTLVSYRFPGNVRELENLVRHAVITANGPEVTAEDLAVIMGSHRVDLSAWTSPSPTPGDPNRTIDQRIKDAFPRSDDLVSVQELQYAYLKHALSSFQGNISRTGRVLGVGRATIYRWLEEDTRE